MLSRTLVQSHSDRRIPLFLRARAHPDGVETPGDIRINFSLYEMCASSQPYAPVESTSVSMRCVPPLSPTLSLDQFQSLCDVCLLSALRSRWISFSLYAMYVASQPIRSRLGSFSLYASRSPVNPGLSLFSASMRCVPSSQHSAQVLDVAPSWTHTPLSGQLASPP